jgi:hypothetical protein
MSDKLTTLEIVRGRLANGRTIADSDVHKLVAEIDRLRAALTNCLSFLRATGEGDTFVAEAARDALGESDA